MRRLCWRAEATVPHPPIWAAGSDCASGGRLIWEGVEGGKSEPRSAGAEKKQPGGFTSRPRAPTQGSRAPAGSHQEAEAEDHRSPQNLPSRTGVWLCNCHLLWNRLDSDTSCLCPGLRAALSACHSSSSNPVHSWPCPKRAPGHQWEGEAGISEWSSILAPQPPRRRRPGPGPGRTTLCCPASIRVNLSKRLLRGICTPTG